jgi:hypothetical protein
MSMTQAMMTVMTVITVITAAALRQDWRRARGKDEDSYC